MNQENSTGVKHLDVSGVEHLDLTQPTTSSSPKSVSGVKHPGKVFVGTHLSNQVKEELERIAEAEGKSVSEVVRGLIREKILQRSTRIVTLD